MSGERRRRRALQLGGHAVVCFLFCVRVSVRGFGVKSALCGIEGAPSRRFGYRDFDGWVALNMRFNYIKSLPPVLIVLILLS